MRIPGGYQIEQLTSFAQPSGRRVCFLASVDLHGGVALVIETEVEGRAPLRIAIPDRNIDTLRDALAMIESRRDTHRGKVRP